MASLTEKYVYAATRGLPEEQRDDVADELRATIADRVDSLLATEPELGPDDAEYAAIAELDDPARMSAGYTGKPLHLIGPVVFPAYVRLLRTLAITVLPVLAVVVAVVQVADGSSAGAVVGNTAWTTFNAAVHLFFWVTLVWALVERRSAPESVAKNLSAEWSPDDLPDPPRKSSFPLTDVIASLAFTGMVIVFLVGQHFWGWRGDGEESLPVIDPALWSGWLPFLIAVLVASAGLEIAKRLAGHWTVPLAATNTVLELAFALPVVYLAATDRLLNPDLLAEFEQLEADPINTVVILLAVLIAAWDTVDGWRKVRRPAAQGSATG